MCHDNNVSGWPMALLVLEISIFNGVKNGPKNTVNLSVFIPQSSPVPHDIIKCNHLLSYVVDINLVQLAYLDPREVNWDKNICRRGLY